MSTPALSSRERGLCQQFCEFTGARIDVAARCLKKNGWNVQQALEAFWDRPEAFAPAVPPCDMNAVHALFEKYKDPDENAIGLDGLLNFCNDLQVSPEDIRMLIFCFNLKVQSAVHWSRQEFTGGLANLGLDSVDKIRNSLGEMQADLAQPSTFKDFYSFAFDISRQEGQKVLELGTAIQLWRMLLHDKFLHLERWCKFLEEEYKKSINKDTWLLTLDFALTADPALANIDLENSAWPILIDEFVEKFRSEAAS